jgi:predicted alpha/beta superfamily hydrolase
MDTYPWKTQKYWFYLIVFLLLTGFIWMIYKEMTETFMEQHADEGGNVGGTFTIYSDFLEEERTFSVRLPSTYNDSEEAFPVLYILDADVVSTIDSALSVIHNLNMVGCCPEVILVSVYNVNRNRDTIPVSVEERPGSGEAESFLEFLDEELIPHIQETYRTTNPTILYGASNAGLFTVYALLERPDSFDAYIASSPMIGWCPDFIHELAKETFSASLRDKFLYMIYGQHDEFRVTEYIPEFTDLIQEEAPTSLRWESRLLEGEGHVPKESLEEGLTALFSR